MAVEAFRLYGTVGLDASQAERGLASFDGRLKTTARNLTMTGGALTAGVTVPLVAVAGKAISMAASYEQSMSMIQYSTQASAAEMELLSAQALQLGADSVFSAEEVADAQLSLAKAGMKSNKIMGAMPGIVDLAAAADMNLSESAETTAEILSMWNLEVEKSTEVANMLAGAANGTTADVADFTMGIKQSGAVLAGYGVPLDDTLTMMGLLANAGLKGSDAGTSLKTMFLSLAAPTDRAATVLQKLGVAIYDNSGIMRSSEAIVSDLRSSLGALSAADRNAAMKDIFGTDGMRAANLLMEATAQEWTDLNEQINADGNASAMAAARMSGLSGALERLSGSVDTFLLSSAKPFLVSLAGWVDQISAAIDWFGTLDPQLQTTALTIGALAAAAGPALIALGAVAAAIGAIGATGMLAIFAISGLALAWGLNIGDMQSKTATAIPVIQGWFTGLSADVTAVGSAIQTAFANTKFPTLDELWKNFQAGDGNLVADKIRNATYTLMVNLDTELHITAQANQLKASLVEAVNSLQTAVGNLNFDQARGKLGQMRDNLLSGLTSALDGVDFGKGSAAFAGLIDKITAGINNLKLPDIDWAGVFTRILLGPMGIAIQGLSWVFSSSEFAGLQTAVKGAIGEIQWGDVGVSLSGLGTAVMEQLSAIGSDMAADVTGAFDGVSSAVSSLFENFKLPEMPKLTFEGFFTGAANIVNGITEAINSQDWEVIGGEFVTTIATAIPNAIKSSGELIFAAGQVVVEMDKAFNEWLLNASTNLSAAMGKWLEDTAASISAAFDKSGLGEAFSGLITTLDQALTGFITGARDTITGAFTGFWDSIMRTDFSPQITKGPDPILSQHENLMAGGFDWAEMIPVLEWPSFITSLSDWASFVPTLTWFSFVNSVSWESFIPDMGWGDFIPDLDWGSFIPRLFGGGSAGGTNSGVIDTNASGTSYFGGGLTWVGERGPELVRLPRGSRIYNNQESMEMAGTGGITINVNVARLNNDMDVESLANRVARVIQKRTR